MKTHRISWIVLFALMALPMIVFYSCQKDDDVADDDESIFLENISGVVQKGPFINGTQIQMYELNASLNQTGISFSTQVNSDVGSFEITDIELASNFVEFSASGFYFNEIAGELSGSQLTLMALSDVSDHTTINVNILTHLEKRRVEYLVKEEGDNYNDAKTTAQSEVLALFGINVDDMDDSESLDFTDDSLSNAALIAISVILQGELGVGDLTELLAKISNGIKDDGVFYDQGTLEDLREVTLNLNLQEIRDNLEERYADLGIQATIPDFEHFIDVFLNHTAIKPSATIADATDIATKSATLNGFVNPGSAETEVIFEYEEINSKDEITSRKQISVDVSQKRNILSGSKNNRKSEKSDYNQSATADQSPLNGAIYQEVSVIIDSLSPGTTHRFRIKAENEVGITQSDESQFTTLGQVPTAITQPATEITTESAVLNATVNPNLLETTVIFEYGLTDDYGNEVVAEQSPVEGNTNISVNAEIIELELGLQYYFRVKAENELGVTYGIQRSFTTLGQAPSVSTLQATEITSESAILNAIVNPNHFETTVLFEWGLTDAYGNEITAEQSPIEGSTNVSVSALIDDLELKTTYHFRVVAENEFGVSYGEERQFNTYGYFLYLDSNPENAGGAVLGAGDYMEGDDVSIIGIPYAGWEFSNWTGDIDHLDDANSAEATVTMPANNVTLMANFQPEDEPGGMICNGNFEIWANGLPDCWYGDKSSIEAANVVQYDANPLAGPYAVQLINAGDHRRFTSQPTSVLSGVTYKITFYVKGQGEIRTGLFDDRQTGWGYAPYNPYINVNSDNWTEHSQIITPANTTDIAEFIFSLRNTNEAMDHILLDYVTIEEY